MNIVFWGEEPHSGTTAHMLAAAGMLSAICPQAEIVIGRSPHGSREVFHFYDCGTGRSRRIQHMLWHADMVFVNLRQERTCIERFFQEDFHIAKDMSFLLAGFDRAVGADRVFLERVYRVEPEKIGVISYNNGFYRAMQQGRSSSFIEREYRMPENADNEQFIRELWGIAGTILRKAEERKAEKRRAEERQTVGNKKESQTKQHKKLRRK